MRRWTGFLSAQAGYLIDYSLHIGLLEGAGHEPEPGRRGRPRKYYQLTEQGRDAVRHSLEMLGRMSEGLALADSGLA